MKLLIHPMIYEWTCSYKCIHTTKMAAAVWIICGVNGKRVGQTKNSITLLFLHQTFRCFPKQTLPMICFGCYDHITVFIALTDRNTLHLCNVVFWYSPVGATPWVGNVFLIDRSYVFLDTALDSQATEWSNVCILGFWPVPAVKLSSVKLNTT